MKAKDELFDYVIGGYGIFGVIIEAEISLTDNVRLLEVGEEVSPSKYVSYFEEMIKDNDKIDMHIYRLSLNPKKLFKTGIAVNYIPINSIPKPAELTDEPARGSRMDRIKLQVIRRNKWMHQIAWNIEKKNALTNKIATRNEVMRPPINAIFNNSNLDTEWLQEYFVKGENLTEFLKYLSKILQKNNVPVFNASVRFVKQDDSTKLSYAKDGDRFAVLTLFNQKLSEKEILKTKNWVREVIDYLILNEGSYYLPYQHFATKEQFAACYPKWQTVFEYKNIVDPTCLF